MKIIDEKGKLFGIINVLDLIVAIVVIAVIGFIGYKVVKHPESIANASTASTEHDMYVTVECRNVPDGVENALKTGDTRLLAQNAYTGGNVYSFSHQHLAQYFAGDKDGKLVISDNPAYKDITIVIKTKVNTANPVLKANGQDCRVGIHIFVKTQTVEVSGVVKNISFDKPVDNPDYVLPNKKG